MDLRFPSFFFRSKSFIALGTWNSSSEKPQEIYRRHTISTASRVGGGNDNTVKAGWGRVVCALVDEGTDKRTYLRLR